MSNELANYDDLQVMINFAGRALIASPIHLVDGRVETRCGVCES